MYDHEKLNAFLEDEEKHEAAGGHFENIKKEHESGIGFYCRCCALSNCCRSFPAVGFMQMLKYAQSGDLVLFDNKCNLGTCIISCFTRSDFDHVGMIFRKPGGRPHEVYIVEALNPRVEINYLSEILDMVTNWDGEGVMYWRPLEHPDRKDLTNYPNGKICPELEKAFFKAAVAFKDKPYQEVPSDMVWSTIEQDAECWNSIFGDCCCGKQEFDEEVDKKNSEDVFCSELVARLYTECGIVNTDAKVGPAFQSDKYLPKDFSADPHAKVQETIKKSEGFNLGPEFKIVRKLKATYQFDASGANAVSGNEASENSEGKTSSGEGGGRNTFVT
jgi:hypothetical protein